MVAAIHAERGDRVWTRMIQMQLESKVDGLRTSGVVQFVVIISKS